VSASNASANSRFAPGSGGKAGPPSAICAAALQSGGKEKDCFNDPIPYVVTYTGTPVQGIQMRLVRSELPLPQRLSSCLYAGLAGILDPDATDCAGKGSVPPDRADFSRMIEEQRYPLVRKLERC